MIPSGKLTSKLEFYVIEEQRNEYNEPEDTLVFWKTVKAQPLKNVEQVEYIADGETYKEKRRFRLRFLRSLTQAHLVKFKEKTYRITSIENQQEMNKVHVLDLESVE